MILALCTRYNIRSTTHAGTKAQFNKHFIKTDLISKEFGEYYTIISNLRNKGDYQDFITFNKQEIEPLIFQTEQFLKIVKEKITSSEIG